MLRFSLCASALASLEVLTQGNFDDFIANNDKVLVKFYAPWCGHCKAMASDFEAAADDLSGKIALGDVDATVEGELAKKYGVNGYPSLKYFNKGKQSDYEGGRKKQDILDWAEEITSAAVSTEAPPEPTTKPIIILHAKELKNYFEAYADGNRKMGKYYHVKADVEKITHQHPNEELNELTSCDETSFAEFMKKNAFPLVGELNGETFDRYQKSGLGLLWCLFPTEAGGIADVAKENAPLMQSIAKEFRGKVAVTYIDTHQFAKAVEGMLGVTEFPAFVIQKKAGDKKKFVYDGEVLEAPKIVQYINDVFSGKIVAELKSEAVPEEQGDVKVVVGSSLKEIVFSATKDVLFEVYAPWCGHCKKLEPEYEKLAAKCVKDADEFVTVAKMDGTANDSPVESIDWSGFPTIVFIKAGSEQVMKYEGGRDAKSMWSYIRENGANKDKISEALQSKYESPDSHDEL